MLVSGAIRLVAKDDIPFGVVQIATALAAATVRMLHEKRAARWAVIVALATVMAASAIAELNAGHRVRGIAILALIALLVAVVRGRMRRAKAEQQSAPA